MDTADNDNKMTDADGGENPLIPKGLKLDEKNGNRRSQPVEWARVQTRELG